MPLSEFRKRMISYRSFRERSGYSIFNVYDTEEKLKEEISGILHSRDWGPAHELYHTYRITRYELMDYLFELPENTETLNRQEVLNDIFKIISGGSADDNLADIEHFAPFIIQIVKDYLPEYDTSWL